jgi:integrase
LTTRPSYNEAIATRRKGPEGTVLGLSRSFQQSEEFRGLAQRSRSDYTAKLRAIEAEFGDLELEALAVDRRTRGIFLDWRDRLAKSSRRQADYAWVVLARLFSRGLNRGKIAINPCGKAGRLYRGSRADKIWSKDDEAAFLIVAPAHLHLPLLLALWTGQRQGDLLRLPWSGYDGTHIRLRQSKTGRRVTIPVGGPLKVMLDNAPKHGPLILVSTNKTSWTEDGFRSSWRKACIAAGIVGLTFHDLRGTAVTRLALAGCTEPEIATITGLSLKTVAAILDAHYLHRDQALAESAIRKLEENSRRT